MAGRRTAEEEIAFKTAGLLRYFVPGTNDTSASANDITKALGYKQKSRATYYRIVDRVMAVDGDEARSQVLQEQLTVKQLIGLLLLDREVEHGLTPKPVQKREKRIKDEQQAKTAEAKTQSMMDKVTHTPLVATPDEDTIARVAKQTGMNTEKSERDLNRQKVERELSQHTQRPTFERKSHGAVIDLTKD